MPPSKWSERSLSFHCVLFFLSFLLNNDDGKQIILYSILQCECLFIHTEKHAPLFADRIEILRNYLNRPLKSHTFDSHIILILTATITNLCYFRRTMFYHNILCILVIFFQHWFILYFVRLLNELIIGILRTTAKIARTHIKITCVIQTTPWLLVDSEQPFVSKYPIVI